MNSVSLYEMVLKQYFIFKHQKLDKDSMSSIYKDSNIMNFILNYTDKPRFTILLKFKWDMMRWLTVPKVTEACYTHRIH